MQKCWAGIFSFILAFTLISAYRVDLAEAAQAESVFDRNGLDCKIYEREKSDGTKVKEKVRTVCADIAALDHMLVYNRFGSFNPYGMIFALTRDLSSVEPPSDKTTADACDGVTGAEQGVGSLSAGNVRLKDCKRARPLVLRANVGDVLHLRITNFLAEEVADLSKDFCKKTKADALSKEIREHVSQGSGDQEEAGDVLCEEESGGITNADATYPNPNIPPDWPKTRDLSIAIQGLRSIGDPDKGGERDQACVGLKSIPVGKSIDCYYEVDREGTYFMSSKAAPAGGEGAGGSITHGLFGAVIAEQKGTAWYRSQVSRGALDQIWKRQGNADQGCEQPPAPGSAQQGEHTRLCKLNYDEGYDLEAPEKIPALRLTKRRVGDAKEKVVAEEIVHSDLNALIYRPAATEQDGTTLAEVNFREFSVFFHDELKSFYTKNFDELARFDQLAGVRDGFAINYGSSGMGTMLLANRKKIGPANDCAECLYEEFFLQSWANGDPALLEQFPDDPSNVHHSYLNDRIVFRNFHAGPKEKHVFHLHAHQWFAGNDANRGAYLDSQTVAPQQGFTYNIYSGGLKNPPEVGSKWPEKGSFGSNGSGNRNRTIGDSIFHCHLYPHFAQGMWELWRVHDVLEDGTRKLPDGQLTAGLSIDVRTENGRRDGSFVRGKEGMQGKTSAAGTPIPAIVPLPDMPLPPVPTYEKDEAGMAAMPGYPFYIPGKPGHRAPQAPMDIAKSGTEYLDGGLPRHVVKDGAVRELDVDLSKLSASPNREQNQQAVAKMLALANFAGSLKEAELELLPYDGDDVEKAAMAFHHDGAGVAVKDVRGAAAPFDSNLGGYPALASPHANKGPSSFPDTPEAAKAVFHVNGSPPKPGAPFADPCGVSKAAAKAAPLVKDLLMPAGDFYADPALKGFRRYEVSAVQLDMVTNRAGWHDPQARINVLTTESGNYKDNGDGPAGTLPISPIVSGKEAPFFFRAASGECIEFRHTNETPKDLERGDFQVRTPTDTIGQHIHLVKFDVMTADGSANGWNYEDGTFAPDEVAARICAAWKRKSDSVNPTRCPGELALRAAKGFCELPVTVNHNWWRQRLGKRDEQPFQTTVQRWFADPILSDRYDPVATAAPSNEKPIDSVDRTMRTVFTHDHFGPSSIQQHGFYSALLIEPSSAKVCDAKAPYGTNNSSAEPRCEALLDPGNISLKTDNGLLVGASKLVDVFDKQGDRTSAQATPPDPTHPDYREYALAIADFATLYDPRDFETAESFIKDSVGYGEAANGLPTIICEAFKRGTPGSLKDRCGSAIEADSIKWKAPLNTPPAWVAGGKVGGLGVTAKLDDLFVEGKKKLDIGQPAQFLSDVKADNLAGYGEAEQLLAASIRYRQRAAGDYFGTSNRLAKPVAAPQRPESISVDHHDPYLVNYRGEPIPLRIGTSDTNGKFEEKCRLKNRVIDWVAPGLPLLTPADEECSITTQISIKDEPKSGQPSGDLSDVFRSKFHNDPATPILEGFSGERMVVRLVQGAQEVQHAFTTEGFTFRRNVDQAFPTGMRALETSPALTPNHPDATLNTRCQGLDMPAKGRPEEYEQWRRFGSDLFLNGHANAHPPYKAGTGFVANATAHAFWSKYEKLIADCDNMEGRVAAQEVGISEHFEFAGQFRQQANNIESAPVAMLGGLPVPSGEEGQGETTDYLYHFGSADALWNGAWGLTRIFLDEGSRYPDLDECGGGDPQDCTAGRRLFTLGDAQTAETVKTAGSAGAGETAKLPLSARQILSCPANAPRVGAIVAALETQRVWGDDGTSYGGGLNDPNGLMFALIDPIKLFGTEAKAREAMLYTSSADISAPGANPWKSINLSKLGTIVKKDYDRPEPLVLRLAANDCLTVFLINGLTNQGSLGGLLDDRGDAPMPRIARLNVESEWGEGPEQEENKLLDLTEQNRFDARSSARLAISVPLPSLNHAQSVPAPYGLNATGALAPAMCLGGYETCYAKMETDLTAAMALVDKADARMKAAVSKACRI